MSDGVSARCGETVTFDTYFNCFSHIKYKKYTTVKRVIFRFYATGKGRVSIRQYCNGEDKIIAEGEYDGNGEIGLDISQIPDIGFLFVAFEAAENTVITSGGWYADAEGKRVKIGIIICTYRREEFVTRNAENLSSFANKLEEPFFDVFIIDNGQTLKNNFGEGFFVIPNENTGGSGGFTRGIKEVFDKGGYTHFLLMDDDISFDANVLSRTRGILATLKEEMKNSSIGGAMLIKDKPYTQLELGADWNGIAIKSHRFKVDIRNREEISLNEEYLKEPQYNGWFYMCMPINTVEKYGYPIRFFIKCDDLEYGLRAAERIIVSSGIAVWHDDFDVKTSMEMEYYIKRNELILNSRFPKGKGVFANWKKLTLGVMKQTVCQRYGIAELIFKAYDDFFKGPEYVFGIDAAKNHAELRKYTPKLYAAKELNELYGITVDESGEVRHGKSTVWKYITFYGYLLPKIFFKKGIAQVDMAFKMPKDFFCQRKVVQFNPSTGKGFVSEIKKSEFWKNGFKLIAYLFKMIFKFKKTAKRYAAVDVMSYPF